MAVSQPSRPDPGPDWGGPDPGAAQSIGTRTIVYVIATVTVLLALILLLRHPVVAGIGVLALGAGAWYGAGEGRRSLGALGGTEVGDSDREHARLVRLVSGVARDLGMERPGVWVFAGSSRNAFVTSIGSRGVVAVSSELTAELALSELEAVMAHCLLRLRDGVPRPRWARSVPGWPARIRPCAPAAYDVGAAALTRYPPGLARAIRKAGPREARDRGLWFVPAVDGECSPGDRAAKLEDL